MTLRPLTHARCSQRVCCGSWSCEPHMADCSQVEHRRFVRTVEGLPPHVIFDRRILQDSGGFIVTAEQAELLSKTRKHGGHGRAA